MIRSICAFSVCLVLCAVPAAQVGDDPGPSGGGTRRALLVGINDYLANDDGAQSEFADLRGACNDVDAMRRVLANRFGFTDFRVLTNADATRSAIDAALDQLAKDARDGDSVLFHFAGHGSQVKDFSGDERRDQLDETLMPYDARTGEVRDILDDDIGRWLARFEGRQITPVVVLDCCHSGTGTRAIGVLARSAPQESAERERLYETAERGVVDLPSDRYVMISGAAAGENALDGPIGGIAHGALTWSLVRSLEAAPPGATAAEVWAIVETNMTKLGAEWGWAQMPDPQLEVDRAAMQRALLPAAPPGSAGLARANSEAAGGQPETGASASSAPALPDVATEIPVFVEAPGRDVTALLGAVAARVPGVRGVAAEEFARLRVEIGKRRCVVRGADGVATIASFPVQADRLTQDLAQVLRRSTRAAALLTLDNPNSRLELSVRAVKEHAAVAVETTERGFKVRTRTKIPTYVPWSEGDPVNAKNSLLLQIRAAAPCYVTIVDVDAEGGVNLLFPTDPDSDFLPDGAIPADTDVRIPESFEADLHWPASLPAGLDTIRVFACTELAAARAVREAIEAIGDRIAQGDPGPEPADLFAGLRSELGTRGVRLVRVAPRGDWDAASVTVRVVDR